MVQVTSLLAKTGSRLRFSFWSHSSDRNENVVHYEGIYMLKVISSKKKNEVLKGFIKDRLDTQISYMYEVP